MQVLDRRHHGTKVLPQVVSVKMQDLVEETEKDEADHSWRCGCRFLQKRTFSLLNTYLSALEAGKLPNTLIVRLHRAD